MLILERHSGETICINDDIKLTVYYHKGSQVKIAIDAPRHINIVREELLDPTDKKKPLACSPPDSNPSEIIELELIQTEKNKKSQPVIKSRQRKRIFMP